VTSTLSTVTAAADYDCDGPTTAGILEIQGRGFIRTTNQAVSLQARDVTLDGMVNAGASGAVTFTRVRSLPLMYSFRRQFSGADLI